MPKLVEGTLHAKGIRFAVVASRYNETACDHLLEGALSTLKEQGAADEQITVVRVPGSWEIPVVAHRLALAGAHDAIIALGVLIRGRTAHFDLIASEVARALATIAATTGVPVAFGVVAAETVEQVLDRTGGAEGNRGRESALAAIEAVNVMRGLGTP